MRHKADRRRLNRTSEHLQALLGNLVTALIHHEQIRTTVPKAKETRRLAERLITKAKDPSLHVRRRVARTIRDKEALQKLFGTIGPRFATRPGGYTRLVKLGNRVGDNAPMAILELVERSPKAQPEGETKDQKAGIEKSAKTAKPAKAPKAEAAAPEKQAEKHSLEKHSKVEAKSKTEHKAKAEHKEKPAAKKTKKKGDE